MKFDPGVLEKVGPIIGYVVAGASAVYGGVKAYIEGSGIISDWRERRHNPAGYQVKSTIDKSVIREERTETIRLRAIRANRRVDALAIDHMPTIVRKDMTEKAAAISNYYAVPGRVTLTQDEMFRIDLMADEEFSAHNDHSVVLGYIMEERRDVLFDPPGVIVQPPVGSDFLVVEVHFPGCVLSKNPAGQPSIRIYSKDPNTKAENDFPWPSDRVDVRWPPQELNWIRVKIKKPPQGREICLDWQWQC
ncbi:MAG: hypothetical protein ACLQOO_29380 [Terriglobia bacterium]